MSALDELEAKLRATRDAVAFEGDPTWRWDDALALVEQAKAQRDAALARAEVAEATVERVRAVEPSHTGCLSWREVQRALDGEAGT